MRIPKNLYVLVSSAGASMSTTSRDVARNLKLSDESIVTIPLTKTQLNLIASTVKRTF